MKNDLAHLNDALHQTLDLLTDETDQDGEPLDMDALRIRIARAGAVSGVAQQIIATGRLALESERLRSDHPDARVPRLISGTSAEGDRD